MSGVGARGARGVTCAAAAAALACAAGLTPSCSRRASACSCAAGRRRRRFRRSAPRTAPPTASSSTDHGAPLQEVRADFRERVLPWVPLAEVSPALVAAVLRSEDKRFHRHGGVDGIALLSAVAGALGGGRARGASTITMQLANLIGPGGGGRGRDAGGGGAGACGRAFGSVLSKVRQARAALRIERSGRRGRSWRRTTTAPLRGELRGVAAAARGIFGKVPGGLDRAESAVLACLLRSAQRPAEVVARRAARLSAALGWDAASAAAAATSPGGLRAPYTLPPRRAPAPHAARLVAPARASGSSPRSTRRSGVRRRRRSRARVAALSGRTSATGRRGGWRTTHGEILA
jgi:penicillin-binding protein 1C